MQLLLATLALLPFATTDTDMPIIGILTKEPKLVKKLFPGENYTSFIDAQYVKFVETAGARPVPVWIGQNQEYYRNIVMYTNGLLLPGGATWFNETNGYADAGKILYDMAVEANNIGEYYPIFGICLGMELLLHIANNERDLRTNCLSKKVALPLDFKEDYQSGKLFRNASKKVIDILRSKNVTYNFHQYCITEDALSSLGLTNDWRIMSTNRDVHGLEFVSALEHKRYPFYGVQFHPEKNLYVHKRTSANIPHSLEAVEAAQYFANVFVAETRKNDHAFSTWTEEQNALIYNFNPRFVRMSEGSSEQLYMFN